MAARVSHTTINCVNAYELSEWWKRALDYTDLPGDPNEPGHEGRMIVDPGTGHRLLFIEVTDLQDLVGRMHLDLAPVDRSRDEEIERVVGLGAREVADRRRPDGSGWMVLEDPVGNRFCVLRSDAERSAQGCDHVAEEPPGCLFVAGRHGRLHMAEPGQRGLLAERCRSTA